jgi:hypothetical protein
MFLADLENATEIVIDLNRRVVPDDGNAPFRGDRGKPPSRGASGRVVGAVRFAHAVVDTVIGRRRSIGFAKSRLTDTTAVTVTTTGEKSYPVTPVRGGTSDQPSKGNGRQ